MMYNGKNSGPNTFSDEEHSTFSDHISQSEVNDFHRDVYGDDSSNQSYELV